MIKTITIVRFLNIFFIPLSFLLAKNEHIKHSYWYEDKNTKCVIVAKDIRQYNATPNTRNVDLRYKNVFILKTDHAVFELSVTDGSYYINNVGDTVYFNLSLYDIYGDDSKNTILFFASIFFVLNIAAIFYLKTWRVFNKTEKQFRW